MRRFNATAFALLVLCWRVIHVFAQSSTFTYQGRLAENAGPANGTYEFRFVLFDAASAGNQIGAPVTNSAVAVAGGNFTVTLDFGVGAFPGASRWLQIGVRTNGSGGAFTTLNPRQPVTSTPYALTAGDVTGANIARLNPPNTAVQATGTPVITSGFITSANMVNGGSGYVTPPLVTVNDTTGSGASIVANISGGSVVSFTVQNPGSGYSAGTTLTVAPPPSNAHQTFAGLNYFGGINHLTNGGNILAGNGSGLNNLNATSLSTGTLADSRLSSNVALLNRSQTFAGTNNFTDPANSFTGSGAGLTSLNASQLAGGVVPDLRLAANVARTSQTWLLGGNSGTTAGTHFLGTTDNQPLEFKVNGLRALRIEPTTNGAPNMIGGAAVNFVRTGVVGAVIGGGGTTNSSGIPSTNSVLENYGVVGGGLGNHILSNSLVATIAGGQLNRILGDSSFGTIAGGNQNTILFNSPFATIGGGSANSTLFDSPYATIPGGRENWAAAYAFAAGFRAKATFTGSFVWADSNPFDFFATGVNKVRFRCTSGFDIVTGIDGSGNQTAGLYLAPGGTSWLTISDREAKKDFAPANVSTILEKLVALPITRWRYRWEDSSTPSHLGPVAQDFKAAFYPGRDDKHISTLEFDGVALAAIQGLNQKLENELKRRDAENAELRQRLENLEKLLGRAQPSKE